MKNIVKILLSFYSVISFANIEIDNSEFSFKEGNIILNSEYTFSVNDIETKVTSKINQYFPQIRQIKIYKIQKSQFNRFVDLLNKYTPPKTFPYTCTFFVKFQMNDGSESEGTCNFFFIKNAVVGNLFCYSKSNRPLQPDHTSFYGTVITDNL